MPHPVLPFTITQPLCASLLLICEWGLVEALHELTQAECLEQGLAHSPLLSQWSHYYYSLFAHGRVSHSLTHSLGTERTAETLLARPVSRGMHVMHGVVGKPPRPREGLLRKGRCCCRCCCQQAQLGWRRVSPLR